MTGIGNEPRHRPRYTHVRQLGLGRSSTKGERGISKRLDALDTHVHLHGERLLDVGCGDGTYTLRMAPVFQQVEAIDIQPGRLDMFRAHLNGTGNITLRQSTAEHLDYPDHSFDMVTAIEVVEHIGDLDAALVLQ